MSRFDLSDYETVATRLERFWKDHDDGRVETWIEWNDPDFSKVVFGSRIYAGDREVATGFAFEMLSQKGVNATSHVENCETSAIGRALANAGYAPSGQRPSREEMEKVERGAEQVDYATPEQNKIIVQQQNRIRRALGDAEARDVYEKALAKLGITPGEPATTTLASQLITLLKSYEFPPASPEGAQAHVPAVDGLPTPRSGASAESATPQQEQLA